MDIFVPKIKEIITQEPISLGTCRVGGEIRMILREVDETVVYDTGWFHNLITNTGLVNMGNASGWASRVLVGTSSQTPSILDTAMVSYLDSIDFTIDGFVSLNPVAPNYQFSTTKHGRFGTGRAVGTIREVGFNYHVTSPANSAVNVRALVSPAITKTTNQVLDVYYRFTRWPEVSDITGTTLIKGVSYDYIVRGKQYTDVGGLGLPLDAMGRVGVSTSSQTALAYSGTIGTIEGLPSSTLPSPWASFVYTGGGSGLCDWSATWDLDWANGNVRSFGFREAGGSSSNSRGWQVRIGQTAGDAALPKDNTEIMTLNFRVNYARI